jgi:chromosome segregation protein
MMSEFDQEFEAFLDRQGLVEEDLSMEEFREQLEDFKLQSQLESEKKAAAARTAAAATTPRREIEAARARAKELETALQMAPESERVKIVAEHKATQELIEDRETALPFIGQDDAALAASLEDAELAYEEATERLASLKAKERELTRPSVRYRRAQRAEQDALAAVLAANKEQIRRRDMAAHARAKEQLLASVEARKLEEFKVNSLNELRGELWGQVTVADANFYLEQRRRELDANPPPEFIQRARQEAEAEYESTAEANSLYVAAHSDGGR